MRACKQRSTARFVPIRVQSASVCVCSCVACVIQCVANEAFARTSSAHCERNRNCAIGQSCRTICLRRCLHAISVAKHCAPECQCLVGARTNASTNTHTALNYTLYSAYFSFRTHAHKSDSLVCVCVTETERTQHTEKLSAAHRIKSFLSEDGTRNRMRFIYIFHVCRTGAPARP